MALNVLFLGGIHSDVLGVRGIMGKYYFIQNGDAKTDSPVHVLKEYVIMTLIYNGKPCRFNRFIMFLCTQEYNSLDDSTRKYKV